MTTLLFARHGQASFGQKNYDKLSPLGEQQAALLGASYAHAGRKIDAVISGSLVRQQDSAKHFLTAYNTGLNLEYPLGHSKVIDGFNEFDHKEVLIKFDSSFATEMGIMAAIADAPVPKVRLGELFNDAMLRWHSGDFDDDYNESWPRFNQRVQKALQQAIDYAQTQDAKNVLIFTSGGVIAAIASGLLQQASSTAYQINRTLINTGVTTVVLKDGKPKLLSLNEHGHLFKDGDRYLTWH